MNNILSLYKKLYIEDTNQSSILEDALKVNTVYPVIVSNHLQKQIKETKSKALSRQFLPDIAELDDINGAGAFFPDETHSTESLVQKYPNRCIIYTTSTCFANCRHCSRKEKWKEEYLFSKSEFDRAFLYIKNTSYFEEVILTGGDILTTSDEDIDFMLSRISSIPHIKVIRIGTRAFTANPKRITPSLCKILSKYKSLIVLTQFNHPDEFSADTIKALQRVQKTGAPVLNQAVLLKGVNDKYIIMKDLLAMCTKNRVIPYYLFHCFKVKGVQCYRTDVSVGTEIINNLVGNIGGWWIPRYILIPHTTGIKVPVCPNGLIENTGDHILLKDFKERSIQYE